MGDVSVISSTFIQPQNINQSSKPKIQLTPGNSSLQAETQRACKLEQACILAARNARIV